MYLVNCYTKSGWLTAFRYGSLVCSLFDLDIDISTTTP
jgi:hypothetical protein